MRIRHALPESLWDPSEKLLRLPRPLIAAYSAVIDACGLREMSQETDRMAKIAGGVTEEDVNRHFAHRFDGSVARAQLALLDPTGECSAVATALLGCFLGQPTVLADCPQGAGAASLSLLCSIAQLRKDSVLPREELSVAIVGGEIAEHARELARLLFDRIREELEAQAIFVELESIRWDATDKMSTTDLVKLVDSSAPKAVRRLILVANFSDFLSKSGKMQAVEPNLEEVMRHAAGEGSVAVWIEPQTNEAVSEGGVLTHVGRFFLKILKLLSGGTVEIEPVLTATADYERALRPGRRKTVRLAVRKLDLNR